MTNNIEHVVIISSAKNILVQYYTQKNKDTENFGQKGNDRCYFILVSLDFFIYSTLSNLH